MTSTPTPSESHAAPDDLLFVVCHPMSERRVRAEAELTARIITSPLMPPDLAYSFVTLDEAERFVQKAEEGYAEIERGAAKEGQG